MEIESLSRRLLSPSFSLSLWGLAQRYHSDHCGTLSSTSIVIPPPPPLLRCTPSPFHIAPGSTTLRVGEQLRHRLLCDSQPPAFLLLPFLLLLRVIRCSRLHSHHLHIPLSRSSLPTLNSKPRCVPHLSNDLLLMLYQLNPANRLWRL